MWYPCDFLTFCHTLKLSTDRKMIKFKRSSSVTVHDFILMKWIFWMCVPLSSNWIVNVYLETNKYTYINKQANTCYTFLHAIKTIIHLQTVNTKSYNSYIQTDHKKWYWQTNRSRHIPYKQTSTWDEHILKLHRPVLSGCHIYTTLLRREKET